MLFPIPPLFPGKVPTTNWWSCCVPLYLPLSNCLLTNCWMEAMSQSVDCWLTHRPPSGIHFPFISLFGASPTPGPSHTMVIHPFFAFSPSLTFVLIKRPKSTNTFLPSICTLPPPHQVTRSATKLGTKMALTLSYWLLLDHFTISLIEWNELEYKLPILFGITVCQHFK